MSLFQNCSELMEYLVGDVYIEIYFGGEEPESRSDASTYLVVDPTGGPGIKSQCHQEKIRHQF